MTHHDINQNHNQVKRFILLLVIYKNHSFLLFDYQHLQHEASSISTLEKYLAASNFSCSYDMELLTIFFLHLFNIKVLAFIFHGSYGLLLVLQRLPKILEPQQQHWWQLNENGMKVLLKCMMVVFARKQTIDARDPTSSR